MAAITDPQYIRFVNEVIRPMAELLRRLDVVNEDGKDTYFAQIAGLVSGNVADDTVEDGREAEGISRLTKGDIDNFITQMGTISTFFSNAGVRDVIRKPTVRPLIQLA